MAMESRNLRALSRSANVVPRLTAILVHTMLVHEAKLKLRRPCRFDQSSDACTEIFISAIPGSDAGLLFFQLRNALFR